MDALPFAPKGVSLLQRVKSNSFLTQNKFAVFFKSFVNWLRSAKMNSPSFSFSNGKLYLIVWKLPFKPAHPFTIFNEKETVEGVMGCPATGQSRAVDVACLSWKILALADRSR